MNRFVASLALICIALQPQAIFAKARTVAVFSGRSDQPLTIVDGVANDLAATIESMPGYEAAIKSPTSGSLGKTAAQAGADMYLLVQTTEYQDGAEIAIVTPYSALDEPLGASSRIRLNNWRFPQDFDASALISAAGVPTSKDPRRLLIPGGTQVVVSTLDTISSANAGANDTFAFRAASDVIVDGFIAIKKGAPGQGTIVSADGAASNGQAGKLCVRFDYIMSADGLKIPLADSDRLNSGQDKKGASSTATILGYAFLGVGGLFMHNFVRGGQMQIEPSAKITVYVDHNVHVAIGDAAAADAGFAK